MGSKVFREQLSIRYVIIVKKNNNFALRQKQGMIPCAGQPRIALIGVPQVETGFEPGDRVTGPILGAVVDYDNFEFAPVQCLMAETFKCVPQESGSIVGANKNTASGGVRHKGLSQTNSLGKSLRPPADADGLSDMPAPARWHRRERNRQRAVAECA